MSIGVLAAAVLAAATVGAGAGAAAPSQAVDPRPDPDACTLLSSTDLEPLLLSGAGGEIDGYSFHPAPGLATCRWTAQPRDHAADAVRRTTTLAFYHLADAARARAQLDRQTHGDVRPSTAIVDGGDDAVVRPSPTIVVARHGADVAVVDATGAELERPDQMEVRYLLDALALKAAGAQAKSPPWVAPGRTARMAPLAPTGSLAGWTPPPHQRPAGAAALEPVIHVVKTLARWRFWLMTVLVPGGFLLMMFTGNSRTGRAVADGGVRSVQPQGAGSRRPALLAAATFALLLLNVLFGRQAATALIERYGETGAATATGSFATSTRYNGRRVIGYRVLIGTVDRGVVSSTFRTDDFNVVGLGEPFYPGVGDVFTVRYLPHHPGDFAIRNDDSSPWARALACDRLNARRDEAARRAAAAPQVSGFRSDLEAVNLAVQQDGCGTP